MIAHDESQWWSNAHLHPINVTETGLLLGPNDKLVWTGTNPTGEATGADCSGWNDKDGLGVTTGDAWRMDSWWVQASPQQIPQCSFDGRLYCLQQ